MALKKLSPKQKQKKAGKVGYIQKDIRASLIIREQNPIGDIISRARASAGRFLANFYQAADFWFFSSKEKNYNKSNYNEKITLK